MKWSVHTLIYILSLILSVGIMDGLGFHYDNPSLLLEESSKSNLQHPEIIDDIDASNRIIDLRVIFEDHSLPAQISFATTSNSPNLAPTARAPPQFI